ncbi:hypothetical protein FGO68_gene9314 [Halteria grandinella]|uniref:Uncharacterized protein n=1 Tax=Halteria grandinella TaxID=5974 RepID=A0A8J8NQD8_HALGN|nr:hypothetical protein FGO68_gene9314 [Halteria grandinella]
MGEDAQVRKELLSMKVRLGDEIRYEQAQGPAIQTYPTSVSVDEFLKAQQEIKELQAQNKFFLSLFGGSTGLQKFISFVLDGSGPRPPQAEIIRAQKLGDSSEEISLLKQELFNTQYILQSTQNQLDSLMQRQKELERAFSEKIYQSRSENESGRGDVMKESRSLMKMQDDVHSDRKQRHDDRENNRKLVNINHHKQKPSFEANAQDQSLYQLIKNYQSQHKEEDLKSKTFQVRKEDFCYQQLSQILSKQNEDDTNESLKLKENYNPPSIEIHSLADLNTATDKSQYLMQKGYKASLIDDAPRYQTSRK